MEARYLTDLEWRICHAINIYVYRNGKDGESPILVHIAPSKKKNMKTILNAIQERVQFPVGYATQLYGMDGRRIKHPCDLEMYNNYVVASNYDKHFKCVQYGRKRSPLLVLNRDSKHIRVLRLHNNNFQDWMLKKKAIAEERPFAPHFFPNPNENSVQPYPQANFNLESQYYQGSESQFYTQPNQSTFDGGKTYRLDKQHQNHGHEYQNYGQEYSVNTCSVVKENSKAKLAIADLQKSESIKDLKPSKSKKDSNLDKKKLRKHERDLLNANVTTEVSSEIVESELLLTCSENTEMGTSSEDLNSRYNEILKKVKRKERNRELKKSLRNIPSDLLSKESGPEIRDDKNINKEDPITRIQEIKDPPKIRIPETNNSKSWIPERNNSKSWIPERSWITERNDSKKFIVLPPPPAQFRDEYEFTPLYYIYLCHME